MGAGIAIQFVNWFKKKYDLNLRSLCSCGGANEGTCIETGMLFNLVTKEHYWDKPTYSSLENIWQRRICRIILLILWMVRKPKQLLS